MSADTPNTPAGAKTCDVLVALVGNPNTGKTTLFNELTGYRQRVGNYPGVTVEKKTGCLSIKDGPDRKIEIVDLPGAYGFSARSRDEMVVIDTLTGCGSGVRPDLIVAVVDAVNLRRNLFLTSQLLELGIPVVVALNMVDLAQAKGIQIDPTALAEALQVPVVPVIAAKGRGVDMLKRAIVEHLGDGPPPDHPRMPAEVVREVEDLHATLTGASSADGAWAVSRVELLQILLEPDGHGERRLENQYRMDLSADLAERRDRLAAGGLDPGQVEGDIRYPWIEAVMSRALRSKPEREVSRSDKVDRFATHPVLGMVFLVLVMGVVFQSIYAWAAPLMDLIEGGFGALSNCLVGMIPEGAAQSLIVHGVLGGVGAVMVFLPQIMILFLFLAILEDCGYLSRAAFLLDRALGFCGLNGKAFIPLVSSFACAVPGIMTTRTIENRADRMVTILVAPLMSCSARLPVYILLIAAFVPARPLLGGVVGLQTMVLIAMYMVGIVAAVLVALFLRRMVFRGERRAFLMELPSYKWPSPRTVLHRVYERACEFVARAGTIIVGVSILIWGLAYYPHPASVAVRYDTQRQQVEEERIAAKAQAAAGVAEGRPLSAELARVDAAAEDRLHRISSEEAGAYLRGSALGRIGRAIEPLVKPLGWDWKLGTAVVASFPAREVVIATLGTIYNLGEDADAESSDLRRAMRAAHWPDGSPVFTVPVALSVMVFFALCMQCGGTLAVIKRETNSWRWPVFSFTYMTALAYLAAFATYRLAGCFV